MLPIRSWQSICIRNKYHYTGILGLNIYVLIHTYIWNSITEVRTDIIHYVILFGKINVSFAQRLNELYFLANIIEHYSKTK